MTAKIDIDSPRAEACRTLLRDLGVETWVHGRIYGLVRDPAAPHGFRLVGEAGSFESLLEKLTELRRARGKL